jgi:hypothetical protein
LLEPRVLLESISAVELVTAGDSSFQNAREKGVNRMKISVAEQAIPSTSLTKSV